MKLSELKKLVDDINTMGFAPEEVEVKIKYTFSEMQIKHAKSSVKAGDKVQPIVEIELVC